MTVRHTLLISLSIITLLVSGCATTDRERASIDRALCVFAVGSAGAMLGAAIDSGNEAPGAVAGGVAGGVLGNFVCQRKKEEPVRLEARPQAQAPAPAPTPAPADSDGDGVSDANDKCPNTPRGVKVNAEGCPLDSDGDGVTDDKDDCPDTPPNTRVNRQGCTVILSLEGVNFAFDSAELTSQAEGKLADTVKQLKDNTSTRLVIEGHTDAVGSDEYNQGLSERRAASVMNYLVGQGIARDRLSSVGKGESEPVASNETSEGRAENRRVDLVVPGQARQ